MSVVDLINTVREEPWCCTCVSVCLAGEVHESPVSADDPYGVREMPVDNGCVMKMVNGVMLVYRNNDMLSRDTCIDWPAPDLDTFLADQALLLQLISDGPLSVLTTHCCYITTNSPNTHLMRQYRFWWASQRPPTETPFTWSAFCSLHSTPPFSGISVLRSFTLCVTICRISSFKFQLNPTRQLGC